jgi:hypothetical protein
MNVNLIQNVINFRQKDKRKVLDNAEQERTRFYPD